MVNENWHLFFAVPSTCRCPMQCCPTTIQNTLHITISITDIVTGQVISFIYHNKPQQHDHTNLDVLAWYAILYYLAKKNMLYFTPWSMQVHILMALQALSFWLFFFVGHHKSFHFNIKPKIFCKRRGWLSSIRDQKKPDSGSAMDCTVVFAFMKDLLFKIEVWTLLRWP